MNDIWPMQPLSIRFLGTGTSQGVPVIGCECRVCRSPDEKDNRLRTSALVHAGDASLLIDAGPDMRQQMLAHDVKHLDAVLLTHEHMDHIAGMDDLRSFNFSQGRAMDIHANAATLEAVKRTFHYAFAVHRYPGVPEFRLHEVEGQHFKAADVDVAPLEVMHYQMPVLGYRIGGLAYITDAKTIDERQMAKLEGTDVLVLNALRQQEHISHLNLKEAIAIAQRVGARLTFFTHISHLMGRHEEVERELPEGIHLAYDGLKVDVQ